MDGMNIYIYNMCREKVEELIYDSYTTCPQQPKDLEIWISYYSSQFKFISCESTYVFSVDAQ